MFSKENIIYAFRNLVNRKTRSFLTILSIFIGITTIFIFISFGVGLFFYIDELSADMGVDKVLIQPKGVGAPGSDSTFELNEDDLNVVKKTRGVLGAAGMMFSASMLELDNKISYQYIMSIPTDDKEDYELILEFFGTYDILYGRWLQGGDEGRVMLGYSYTVPGRISDKGLKLGDKIELNGTKLKIIGFIEEVGSPLDDAQIYLTEDTFRKIKGQAGEKTYGMISANVDDVNNIDEIVERITKNLRKSKDQEEGKEDFFVQSYKELIESFANALNIVIGFIILIALVSILVSAINTANTMFTSILERTKEIGVLKAIGARNFEIMTIFLIESSILGMVAGIIGVVLGWIIAVAGGTLLQALGWGFLSPYFPWWLFLGCIAFSTIVGTVSGLIPAYNASKKNPVDSLRYE